MSCSRSVASPRRPSRAGGLPLARLAELRAAAYRVLGASLLYPEAGWLAGCAGLGAGLRAETRPLARFACWPAWARFVRLLGRLSADDLPSLERQYVACFVAAPDRTVALPYESAWAAREAAPAILAALDRQYAGAGFAVAPSLGEPPDHAAVELEFLSVLCAGEAAAWRWRAFEAVAERLRRQARFIAAHPGAWIPRLADRLAADGGCGFYPAAVEAARAFLAHDRDLVAALLERLERGTAT